MKKINVFIVDDSALIRKILTQLLATDPAIRCIGAAADPIFALQKMAKQWPDVIVLDIEMPRMDGITFLKKIMEERPTPVVMCSSLTEAGATTTMQALSAGAVDIISKPKIDVQGFFIEESSMLLDAIKSASKANLKRLATTSSSIKKIQKPPETSIPSSNPPIKKAPHVPRNTARLIAIGTSTGGTQALESILKVLPSDCPGIVIVQHMPEKFTYAFAQRLDSLCELKVKEAEQGDKIQPGLALIAPGSHHMVVKRMGNQYQVQIRDGPLVSRHRPSVDVLFKSVRKSAANNAMGIIMTGMGSDGAAGLLEMYQAGAYTIAQDEKSCIVYGMPKEAVNRGAVVKTVALQNIADEIINFPKININKVNRL